MTNLTQSKFLDAVARKIEQACPRCLGTRRVSDVEAACAVCSGSGKEHPYAETGVGGWLRDRPCPECRGAGIQTTIIPTPLGRIKRTNSGACGICYGSGKEGSEWPSLVWVGYGIEPEKYHLDWWKSALDVQTHLSWFHILEDEDAFALLEEAGWFIRREWHVFQGKTCLCYWATKDPLEPRDDTECWTANTPKELLEQILAGEAMSALLTDADVRAMDDWRRVVSKWIYKDVAALIADREERTRLLREAYPFLYHHWQADAGLIDEIREAVKA